MALIDWITRKHIGKDMRNGRWNLHGATEVSSETSGDSFSPAKGNNSRPLKKKQDRYSLPRAISAISAMMILSVVAAQQLTALPTHDRHQVCCAQWADSVWVCSVTG